ncbi:hypothetical protein D3C74_396190 [compost metagenome]
MTWTCSRMCFGFTVQHKFILVCVDGIDRDFVRTQILYHHVFAIRAEECGVYVWLVLTLRMRTLAFMFLLIQKRSNFTVIRQGLQTYQATVVAGKNQVFAGRITLDMTWWS